MRWFTSGVLIEQARHPELEVRYIGKSALFAKYNVSLSHVAFAGVFAGVYERVSVYTYTPRESIN